MIKNKVYFTYDLSCFRWCCFYHIRDDYSWYILYAVTVITGIALEIANLHSNDILLRGLVFLLIGVVLLIPSGKHSATCTHTHTHSVVLPLLSLFTSPLSSSVYAVTHIYLAAKRIGRVRFSSVWFFR